MGKKKAKVENPPPEEPKRVEREPKAKKNYSFATTHARQGGEDGMLKVQLPAAKEAAVVDLIQQHYHLTRMEGRASHRVTAKKLTDFYMSLSKVGFRHSQIESAMTNTVQYGGDLLDALDWLCLNVPNDQLPAGFSVAMMAEDRKKRRVNFDETEAGQATKLAVADMRHGMEPQIIKIPATSTNNVTAPKPAARPQTAPAKVEEKDTVKDWILRFADRDSSDDESMDEAIEDLHDPNDRYLVLTAKLLDAKAAAALAKEDGDKKGQKEATTNIRTYSQEMSQLEEHPSFNPALKVEEEEPEPEEKKKKKKKPVEESVPDEGKEGDDDAMGAFALFEEQAAAEKPKPKPAKEAAKPLDKRTFEYTRKQWTGKSPKQFLIDWVRKHESKSPAPGYNKAKAGHNLWRSTCKVVRKEAGTLSVTPEIVTETKMESEHLASTLALYHLCKGQRVYQLLPPPYRDVWLEWQDAEDKVKEDAKAEENKPRDQYVAKLLKTLKLEEKEKPEIKKSPTNETVKEKKMESTKEIKKEVVKEEKNKEEKKEDVEDTWEDLAEEIKKEDVGANWEDLAEEVAEDGGDGDTWEELASEEESPKPSPKVTKKQPVFKSRASCFDARKARETFARRRESRPYKTLLAKRQDLPVYHHREQLLDVIRRNSVVVIAGETGSGKSTQIPQFIIEEFLTADIPSCNVVVTEPRRISAQSLAGRVSQELGEEKPGATGSFCGYQIRFEAARSDTTRLLYCTTGVLLRKLQLDPMLSDVTHVVIDEVHERSVNSDFLLIIVKQILEKRKDFKVILMSATVDSDKFSGYFQHCPVYHIPGRTFPVEVYHLEDVVEQTDYKLEEDSVYCLRADQLQLEDRAEVSVTGARGTTAKTKLAWTKEDMKDVDLSGLDPDEYSKHTRNVVTRMNPKRINHDLIMELLRTLDEEEPFCGVAGAVLVFMPGLAQIQELYELLQSDRRFSNSKRYKLVALHSVLSSADQNSAFDIPPEGVRKIVIATNIAETGITIPDVVFVVDAGKVKENRYMETSQMSALLEVYVSKASARQRQGRAGRVQEGYCFRLYTKAKYDSLRSYTVPEILRVPLEEMCLHIMKCELGNPVEFLSRAIDAPPPMSVTRAMGVLREVGACQPTEAELTPLGQHLATLPVNVRIGKMLIFGAIFGCLEPVAVIAASMSDKSPFASPIGQRDKADAARRSMAIASADHLTLYNAFSKWKAIEPKGKQAEIELCNTLFLKRNVLIDINNLAKDLIKLIHTIGFFPTQTGHSVRTMELSAPPLSTKQFPLLKAVLTAGLYSHIARTSFTEKVDDAANKTKSLCYVHTPQGPATCHPSSVNRFLNVNGWVVYHEKVRHTQIYLKDTTLISPYPLLLFGGDIEVQHREKVVTIDGWIKFKAFARTAVIFKELRILIDNLLERKMSNPAMSFKDDPVVEMLHSLITSER